MTTDVWSHSHGTTSHAQRDFDRCSGTYTDDERTEGLEAHATAADDGDRARVDALTGDLGERCAWYWRPLIAGDHAADRGSANAAEAQDTNAGTPAGGNQ